MLDGQIAILENAVARYAVTGVAPGPLGARHPSITPFAAYACQGGHIVIAAGNDALWAALLDALDLSALKGDPRFASNALRTEAADAIAVIIETVLLAAPAAHWLPRLEAAGVPCGPLHDVAEALAHPQVLARGMVIETAFPDGTPLLAAGNPVKLSRHADPLVRPGAPGLDADRDAILRDLGV
jgi:CoA:oxalate CoA-transferase